MTVQSALAVAMAVVLKLVPSADGTLPEWFVVLSVIVIPIVGILVSNLITDINVRERAWQAWYVDSYNELPGNAGKVFPADQKTRLSPDQRQPGYMARLFIRFNRAIIAVWVLVILVSVLTVVLPQIRKLL
jgi:hypothetical protein